MIRASHRSARRNDARNLAYSGSIELVMYLLSKKWTIFIVTTIGNYGTLRYGELEQKVRGVSPATLAERLKELGRIGLVKRERYNEVLPKVVYSLAEEGLELRDALVPVLEWMQAQGSPRLYDLK
jgi:DNA-binding HxlR family transcriptional regulator